MQSRCIARSCPSCSARPFADASPRWPSPDADLRIEPERYIGRYENIQSAYVVDMHRNALRFSTIPKAEMGMRLTELPMAFIDRETAVLRTGNPQLDGMSALFSDLVDGRYRLHAGRTAAVPTRRLIRR